MQLIWDDFLNIIKQEAGTQVVETWFKAVKLERWDSETRAVYFLMPNPFVKKWIQEHYTSLIKTHLSRLLHAEEIKLIFYCQTGNDKGPRNTISPLQKPLLPEATIRNMAHKNILPATFAKNEVVAYPPAYKRFKSEERTRLNPNYTFESLIVGPSNSLAHAAAVAISQNPGRVYNPLFIYGKTGLGKTHLLHAIGNEIKKKNKLATVLYKTSDNFITEFINSIRSERVRHFREKYQRVDLLLLDDIQFFSKKEQTQETFFHIFDCLYGKNKQVIFSSDTLPQDISGLQSRLKSRLQSGLIADIQVPTMEMKVAILKKKIQMQGLVCDDEVTKFIASQNISSIRELEGYLIRLSAFASLTGEVINMDMANQVVSQLQPEAEMPSSIDKVIKTVAKYCYVSVADIKSKNRSKNIALARQIAFYMLKSSTDNSFRAIGEHIGGRNHTTVLHAVTKIAALKEINSDINEKIVEIKQSLQIPN